VEEKERKGKCSGEWEMSWSECWNLNVRHILYILFIILKYKSTIFPLRLCVCQPLKPSQYYYINNLI